MKKKTGKRQNNGPGRGRDLAEERIKRKMKM